MSGSLKATTIKGLLQRGRLGYALPVFSVIKPWKTYHRELLEGLTEKSNNLDLAALSLCNLENVLMQSELDPDIEFILAERGVLDNIWYWMKVEGKDWRKGEGEDILRKVREAEIQLEEKYGFTEMRNTMLVMEDRDFIKSHVLKTPARKEIFPDVDTYLKEQDDYCDFLLKYGGNKLHYREIKNAPEYLSTKLRIKVEN